MGGWGRHQFMFDGSTSVSANCNADGDAKGTEVQGAQEEDAPMDKHVPEIKPPSPETLKAVLMDMEPDMRYEKRVIATQVFPETVPWARMMIRSLEHSCVDSLHYTVLDRPPIVLFTHEGVLGGIGEDYVITLDTEHIYYSLEDRVNRGVNDMAKAMMFRMLKQRYDVEEMLYIDADCLVLSPIDEIFDLEGDILLACERHDDYQACLKRTCETSEPMRTLNAGVILLRVDPLPSWWENYVVTMNSYRNDPHVEGQTVWNIVWHKTHNARVLPRKFNQLHVRHGPHGAVIYHLAGVDNNMKTEVMANLFNHFFGVEQP